MGDLDPATTRVRAAVHAVARTYVPQLTRPVWILQAGGLVNALGTGLVLPFVLIYLHEVIRMPLELAGVAVGGFGLASLVATPFAGRLVDSLGARTVLRASLLVLACGYGALSFARTAPEALGALALAGLGNGAFWPSQSALVMGLTHTHRRAQASALGRTTYNVGLGAGGALGGLILAGASIVRYELLFGLDAATFVVLALASLAVPELESTLSATTVRRHGYREVARDRVFLALIALNVFYVAGAFAPFETALPLYSREHLGLAPRVIGLVFLANMLTVGVLQLPAARAIEGHRRVRLLAGMTGIWALAFALIFGAGALPAALTVGLLVLAAVVFGAGECMLGPTQSPLIVELAPPALRGRYLALLTASYALGFTLGPPLAAAELGLAPNAVWLVAASICVLTGLAGLLLGRRLPASIRLAPRSTAQP